MLALELFGHGNQRHGWDCREGRKRISSCHFERGEETVGEILGLFGGSSSVSSMKKEKRKRGRNWESFLGGNALQLLMGVIGCRLQWMEEREIFRYPCEVFGCPHGLMSLALSIIQKPSRV